MCFLLLKRKNLLTLSSDFHRTAEQSVAPSGCREKFRCVERILCRPTRDLGDARLVLQSQKWLGGRSRWCNGGNTEVIKCRAAGSCVGRATFGWSGRWQADSSQVLCWDFSVLSVCWADIWPDGIHLYFPSCERLPWFWVPPSRTAAWHAGSCCRVFILKAHFFKDGGMEADGVLWRWRNRDWHVWGLPLAPSRWALLCPSWGPGSKSLGYL